MKKFVIVADATCDLGNDYQEKYDIKVLRSHVLKPDGKEFRSIFSWDEIGREDFYKDLKKNPDGYSTAPANVQEFTEVFTKYIEEGCDILCMTISSGISGTYGFACSARDAVLEANPDANIKVIDTLRFGPGFGLMTVCAAALRDEGYGLDTVAQYVETNKNRFHQAGWLDDLSFVAKKGRMTHGKAFMGQLIGIKPIGEFDYNGMTTVIGKIKGEKKAYEVLMHYIEETIENPSEQIIFIAQTNRLPQAEKYKAMIEEKFKPKAVVIRDVFPACGVNIGPGLMAAYYMGTPISEDLGREKAIVEKYSAAE